MKILFLCTAHNSLSQRLYLALKDSHQITIEYAISQELMLSAVTLSKPDLIICPFLTTIVPKQIHENYLTLIVHPGPPGDAGPSSLDWMLMGDDGSIDDSEELLRRLSDSEYLPGRRYWGVTVLQAIEELDAGPIWAFEQFPIDIDDTSLTKSTLYRGSITRCAIDATLAAISRIQFAGSCSPQIHASPAYRTLSVGKQEPFHGGRLHCRPLLRATQRDFNTAEHSAQQISRRIRCSDSQPGALSRIFGQPLYIYGGTIEDNIVDLKQSVSVTNGRIIACRNGAVCIATRGNKGVWISHIRQPKTRSDKALHPKVPAASGLVDLNILSKEQACMLEYPVASGWDRSSVKTFQEIWVDMRLGNDSRWTAYLHFDIYNGAMTTDHCSRLIDAMDHILNRSTNGQPVQAVVLMGGAYFSNGIALNVIEAADDSSHEAWVNINRINDVVHYLLYEFPSRGIATIAALRGNAAAGGVALATACDVVIASNEVVLNPAYRAIGLHGSEYHTISYYARCGRQNTQHILRAMLPMSPKEAALIGLVDFVIPGTGDVLDGNIRTRVNQIMETKTFRTGLWKSKVSLSLDSLAQARTFELREMALDFWSWRSVRFHSRRFHFIRKVKPDWTPLRFAEHRRNFNRDEEESDTFDNVEHYKILADQQRIAIMKAILQDSRGIRPNQWNYLQQSLAVTPLKDTGTIFSCYFGPEIVPPPTPPDSPMESDESSS